MKRPDDKALAPGGAGDPVETYGLQWPGKAHARALASLPPSTRLTPAEAGEPESATNNLFIEGDNLEALRHLRQTHRGTVKMIYIDPPYNTGGDMMYHDDFGRAGFGGRPDWLSMMFPRLLLAWELLADDGALFVQIDDNEAAHLKLLCDEAFGPESYRVTHYVQVRYPGKTLAERNSYQKLMEQVLVYAKQEYRPIRPKEPYPLENFCWQITEHAPGRREVIGGRDAEIFLPGQWSVERIPAGLHGLKETWASGSVLKVNASGRFFATYLAPRKATDGTGVLYKVSGIGEDGLGYRYFTGPKRADATKGKFYAGVPLLRRHELENGNASRERPIVNYMNFADAFGNCRHEGGVDFRGGKKPVAFLKGLIAQASDGDDIIVDFFAGSASMAQAVFEMNAEDGHARRFVLVQTPEPINARDKDVSERFSTISELAAERIRRSADTLFAQDPERKADLGFRHFRLSDKR